MHHLTHLPVIVDPSHATGKRWLVKPLAIGGVAVGADGIMVEVHPRPDEALSDAEQQLDFEMFESMMERGHRRARARQGPPRRPPPGVDGADREWRRLTPMTRPAGSEPAVDAVPPPMTDDALVVRPAARLRGSPSLPGDKSISHRALLLALLAEGESADHGGRRWRGRAVDGRRSSRRSAPRVERPARARRPGRLPGGLARAATRSPSPSGALDCGNSGTTTRLRRRAARRAAAVRDPRRRRLAPAAPDGAGRGAARARWARGFAGREGGTLLPLAITGSRPPDAHRPPTRRSPAPRSSRRSCSPRSRPRARPRSPRPSRRATTPSGCSAPGASTVRGDDRPGRRPHRAPRRPGPPVRRSTRPSPSDPSGAAFWLVAAAIHPDAELHLEGVSTNPTRRAIIDILRRMGAAIEEHAPPAPGGADGEPLADLVVRSSRLRAVDLSPADVAAAIDEIPVLALAAAVASGTSRIRGRGGAPTQGVRPGRRASRTGLTALGADVRVEGDDIEIHGGTRLTGAVTETLDDHRLAMTFAVAGLIAEGETVSADPVRRRSPTPASSANSKGCEHDEARRPHRPPGGPLAVRRDAAGGVRPRSASTPAYELWDRAPIALADAIAELRTDDFLGANVTIPHKERVVPHGRPPDRGGPRDRRGQHAHQGGPQARRPQHRRARVQGRARPARRPPEDAAQRGRAGRRRRARAPSSTG